MDVMRKEGAVWVLVILLALLVIAHPALENLFATPSTAPTITQQKGFINEVNVPVSNLGYGEVTRDNALEVTKEFVRQTANSDGLKDSLRTYVADNTVSSTNEPIVRLRAYQEFNGIPTFDQVTYYYKNDELFFYGGELAEGTVVQGDVVSFDEVVDAIARDFGVDSEELSIISLYSHTPNGLGLVYDESGKSFIPEYRLVVDYIDGLVPESYVVTVNAYTGEVRNKISAWAHAPLTGTITSEYQTGTSVIDPGNEYNPSNQRVWLTEQGSTVAIAESYTDLSGTFSFDMPAGNYDLHAEYASDAFRLSKFVSDGEPISEAIVPVSTGVDNSWHWINDDQETSPWSSSSPQAFPEATLYYHTNDLFNRYVYDYDLPEILPSVSGYPPSNIILSGGPGEPCTGAGASPSGTRYSYRPDLPPQPSGDCNRFHSERIVRHETAHMMASRLSYFSILEGGGYGETINFPYIDLYDLRHHRSIHEGQAEYISESTGFATGTSLGGSYSNFFTNYLDDSYDPHGFGKFIHVEGAGFDQSFGDPVIFQRLLINSLALIPDNMHELLDALVYNDDLFYGGVHVEAMCEAFADGPDVISNECWTRGFSNGYDLGVAINPKGGYEYVSRPVNNQIQLTFDVSEQSSSYEIRLAEVDGTMSSGTVVASGSCGVCGQDMVRTIDVSGIPDGYYRLRFRASGGGDTYDRYVFFALYTADDRQPLSLENYISGTSLNLVDLNGDGTKEISFFTEARNTFYTGQFEELPPRIHSYDQSGAQISTPTSIAGYEDPSWTYETYPGVLHVEDINDDGVVESFLAVGERVTSYTSAGTQRFNQFYDQTGQAVALTVFDKGNDGQLEFLVQFSEGEGLNGVTRFYMQSGFPVANLYIDTAASALTLGARAGPAVADVTSLSPDVEFILGTKNGGVQIHSSIFGEMLTYANWPLQLGSEPILARPIIADVDNDGTREILVKQGTGVYILGLDGSIINGPFGDFSVKGELAVGDVDNDGDLEIYGTNAQGLVGYHHTGASVATYVLPINTVVIVGIIDDLTCSVEGMSPVIADITNDGTQEIVVASTKRCPLVVAYEHDGPVAHTWPVDFTPPIRGACSGFVCSLQLDGNELYNESISLPVPRIEDIDNDNLLEVVIADNTRVHVWDLESPVTAPADWPMFHHDRWQTNDLAFVPPEEGMVVCIDGDSDGYGSGCALGPDCNDANPDVYPGAPEICDDGIDNQCSGTGFGDVDCADASCSSDPACSVECVVPSDCAAGVCTSVDCVSGSCVYTPTPGASCTAGIACGTGTCGGPGGAFCQGINVVDCSLPACGPEPECIGTSSGTVSSVVSTASMSVPQGSSFEYTIEISCSDDDCGIITATLDSIPVGSGTPFFISDGSVDSVPSIANPQFCDLQQGESCSIVWEVTATGSPGTSDNFVTSIEYGASTLQSDTITVDIIAGGCGSDLECGGATPYCNVGTGQCVACLTDTHCSEVDGNQCTTPTCSAGFECVEALAFGQACDDGNACTVGTTCNIAAQCVGGAPLDVDDSNACTIDSCDSITGEQHDPVDCSFLDGQCTAGTCNPLNGMCESIPANEGLSCVDGLSCTELDVCAGGVCSGSEIDADGDMVGLCPVGVDCDDTNPDVYPGAPELCDGIDNQCNGDPGFSIIDEGYALGAECTVGLGECQASGMSICSSDGLGTVCSVSPGTPPEADEVSCDGLDNDCDGDIDEGCGCTQGDTQSCGSDVGECSTGTQTCGIDGTWGTCVGSVGPTAEICDGLDNNCDGSADETSSCPVDAPLCSGGACVECVGNADCGGGFCSGGLCVACLIDSDCADLYSCTIDQCINNVCSNTPDNNACSDGACFVGVCDPSNPGADNAGCYDNPLPSTTSCSDGEFCNGEEFCDGSGSCGVGSLQCTEIAQVCDDESDQCQTCSFTSVSWNVLSADEGDSVTLTVTGSNCANGLGVTFDINEYDPSDPDDAITTLTSTFSGDSASAVWTIDNAAIIAADGCMLGICEYDDGVAEFYFDASLTALPSVSQQTPVTEPGVLLVTPLSEVALCEDGEVRDCPLQTGSVCSGVQETCVDGSWGGCDYGADYELVESQCDGLDNDCDGTTDEIYPELGDVCTVGVGACARDGAYLCSVDGSGTMCSAVAGTPGTEMCDGIDNDCDSEIDEASPGTPLTQACYTGPIGTLGVGECQAGVATCSAGSYGMLCPGEVRPQLEICDGLDNDCDGMIDEDDVCITPPMCGNGVREGSEQCDGTDLGGMVCGDLGYSTGTLGCIPFGMQGECTFDVSACLLPSVTITAPADDEVIIGDVTFAYVLDDWTVGNGSDPHVHYYLDGDVTPYKVYNDSVTYLGDVASEVTWVSETMLTLHNLGVGSHTLRVVLANGDDTELSLPEAEDMVVFSVDAVSAGSVCGDAVCSADESCDSCSADCGACPSTGGSSGGGGGGGGGGSGGAAQPVTSGDSEEEEEPETPAPPVVEETVDEEPDVPAPVMRESITSTILFWSVVVVLALGAILVVRAIMRAYYITRARKAIVRHVAGMAS